MTDAPETPVADAPALPTSDPAPEEPVNLEIPEEEVELETAEPEEPQEPDEELEEFEWEGKAIKGPKGLKDGVLRQADYTRKTQEVAERRKELEAYEHRVREQAKASDEEMSLRAQFLSKAQELQQYRNGDWNAYWQQDPVAAGQAQARWQNLERELNGIATEIKQRTEQRNSEAQQEHAKRLSDTLEHARKNIRGWSTEVDQKIGDLVRGKGIPDADLQAVMSPAVYDILHLAYLGQQALNKPVALKPATPPPQPLPVVAAKAAPPVRKSPQDMSMDEYAAWRAKGGGGGRRS